jgi:hypothetical protein
VAATGVDVLDRTVAPCRVHESIGEDARRVALGVGARLLETLGVGCAGGVDQTRCHLGLRERADLGDLEPRRLPRHREVGDGTVHELPVTAPTPVGAVEVDPLRERCRRLDVDARHLLVADPAGVR